MIVEIDGQTYDVPDDATEAEIASLLGMQAAPPEPMPNEAGLASGLAMGARAVPGIVQSGARFAANHPAAVQKAIGAGVTGTAATVGGMFGGVPGAIAGGAIRGATPTQAAIREGAGRLAGEAPAAARGAGRAMGVVNYAKEVPGLKLTPSNLVSTGEAASAVDNFAESMGQKIVRLYGPDNRMVLGPEVLQAPKAPGIVRQAVGKAAGAVGKVLSPLSAATGITDFAQTVEPDRTDIGVMGIGRSQPTPEGDELAQLNARNTGGMYDRLATQDAERQQLIAKIAALLGLR